MTSPQLNVKVRTFLDESSEDFFSDDEIYTALSSAQLEIANVLSQAWKQKHRIDPFTPVPITLQGLITTESGTIALGTNSVSWTNTPLAVISCFWQHNGAVDADTTPAVEISQGENSYRLIQNPLLADGNFYWWNQTTLYVNPKSTSVLAEYNVTIIDTPTDIGVSTNPEIGDVAHDALCERALWLLMKDEQTALATQHLTLYSKLIQGLMK